MNPLMIRTIITEVTEGEIKRFGGSGRPGETFADREVFQHYGYTSRPLPGAEGILIKQGNQVQLIASDDRRYRIELAEGEVALYTDEGDHIHMKRGRLVEVVTDTLLVKAATKVRFETPLVEATDELQVGENIGAGTDIHAGRDITADEDITDSGGSGRSMASMREKYNLHKHPEDASGDTEEPRPEDLM